MKPSATDATLSGPDSFSERQTAFRFDEARAHVRNAVRCAEADGISSEFLALIGEALPPIVHEHGPIWAATILMKLARRLRAWAKLYDLSQRLSLNGRVSLERPARYTRAYSRR
jgi:hypothetical protein